VTATAQNNGSFVLVGTNQALPATIARPLPASSVVGRGQFTTVSASTGYAALNDGTVPNQLAGGIGYPNELSDVSSVAGAAAVQLWEGWGYGLPASTESNDGFANSDFGVPFYIANENTPGALSNFSGSNRSLGGLVFGLAPDGTPYFWTGAVAALVAKGVAAASAVTAGSHNYAVDAGAGTDLTEVIFNGPPAKLHGRITGVDYIPNATLGVDGSNYKTLTVTKYDANGANGVVVGTLSTAAGFATKWKTYAFTLSATSANLDKLEGDVFTIQNAHTGSGSVTPAGQIRVTMKVG